MDHDGLYWAFSADEQGPAFGPVTDKDTAVARATAWGEGAFVLGINVTFAAYPNWTPNGEQSAGVRTPLLPPCPVCGFDNWASAASPAIARSMHMRAHERAGEQTTEAG